MDDAREQLQRRVVQVVLLEKYLERTEPITVREPCSRRVVGVRALSFGDLEHLLSRNVEESRVGVDEVLDQPRASDPVGLRAFASNPLHVAVPLMLRSRAGPASRCGSWSRFPTLQLTGMK